MYLVCISFLSSTLPFICYLSSIHFLFILHLFAVSFLPLVRYSFAIYLPFICFLNVNRDFIASLVYGLESEEVYLIFLQPAGIMFVRTYRLTFNASYSRLWVFDRCAKLF
jgi:hypothetical protein